MRKIFYFALLTVKQATREKSFWLGWFLLIALIGFALFLGELTAGEKEIVLRNAQFSFIELSGLFLIVFGFIYGFYREKETRLQEVYLTCFSRPVYLCGKLLGYIVSCGMYILLASLLCSVFLWANHAFIWQLFWGSFSIFLKLSILCGVSLVFSCLFEFPLMASVSTLFVYVSGETAYNAFKIIKESAHPVSKMLFTAVYHLLPSADKVDFKYPALYGDSPAVTRLLLVTAYAGAYVLFTYCLANVIFERKKN
ncbi:MAG TPA: hypothetical protein P5110_02245 [Candidatus Omnitrophota bacterium]|nr:hypothetical protein [Candidatus Omnitrophota bacterium]